MTDGQIVNTNSLTGLELAKYVLLRLVNDHDNIEKIAVDFDNDEKFVSGVVDFLIDVEWMMQDKNGEFKITGKGKTYTISRKRPLVNFRTST